MEMASNSSKIDRKLKKAIAQAVQFFPGLQTTNTATTVCIIRYCLWETGNNLMQDYV